MTRDIAAAAAQAFVQVVDARVMQQLVVPKLENVQYEGVEQFTGAQAIAGIAPERSNER